MNDKTTRREALSIVGMYRYALLKNERNEWAPEADRRKKEEGGGGRRVLTDRTSMVMSEQAKCGPGKNPRRVNCMGKGGYANKGGEAGEGYTMCRLSEREDLVCHRGDIHFDGGRGRGGNTHSSRRGRAFTHAYCTNKARECPTRRNGDNHLLW